MKTFDARAAVLAQTGPELAQSLSRQSGETWRYTRGREAVQGALWRAHDGMRLSIVPGWYDGCDRFELAPLIQTVDGRRHSLVSLGVLLPGNPPLRVHVSRTGRTDPLAADIMRRLVQPYGLHFAAVCARLRTYSGNLKQQADTVAIVAQLTGAEPRICGTATDLPCEIGGVRLPLHVYDGDQLVLGTAPLSLPRLQRLVAGLQRVGQPQGAVL